MRGSRAGRSVSIGHLSVGSEGQPIAAEATEPVERCRKQRGLVCSGRQQRPTIGVADHVTPGREAGPSFQQTSSRHEGCGGPGGAGQECCKRGDAGGAGGVRAERSACALGGRAVGVLGGIGSNDGAAKDGGRADAGRRRRGEGGCYGGTAGCRIARPRPAIRGFQVRVRGTCLPSSVIGLLILSTRP